MVVLDDGIVIEWTMAMRCDKKQTDEFSLVSAVYIHNYEAKFLCKNGLSS